MLLYLFRMETELPWFQSAVHCLPLWERREEKKRIKMATMLPTKWTNLVLREIPLFVTQFYDVNCKQNWRIHSDCPVSAANFRLIDRLFAQKSFTPSNISRKKYAYFMRNIDVRHIYWFQPAHILHCAHKNACIGIHISFLSPLLRCNCKLSEAQNEQQYFLFQYLLWRFILLNERCEQDREP